MARVTLYADGSCARNPDGPGGAAVILTHRNSEREIATAYFASTNNRMEVRAVLLGLNALKWPCEVLVVSDSEYVCNPINLGWLERWERKKYKRAGEFMPNHDLWIELNALIKIHSISAQWVKGHKGHPQNERCDKLAGDIAKSGPWIDDLGWKPRKQQKQLL